MFDIAIDVECTPTDAELDEAFARIWLMPPAEYTWLVKAALGDLLMDARRAFRSGASLESVREVAEGFRFDSGLSGSSDPETIEALGARAVDAVMDFVQRQPFGGSEA